MDWQMGSATTKTRRGDKETRRTYRLPCSKSSCLCVLLIGLLSSLAGCSGSGMESQVSGRVTLDSAAAGPGIVSFAPVDEKHNPAIGTIDARGRYSLKTSRTPGLPAGKYRVGVYIHTMPPGAQPGERLMSTPSAIPEKYENVETSGLTFDVQPGSNTIDIRLTSK
jgi:hypothetical protein